MFRLLNVRCLMRGPPAKKQLIPADVLLVFYEGGVLWEPLGWWEGCV
jgi:hypothetical protein